MLPSLDYFAMRFASWCRRFCAAFLSLSAAFRLHAGDAYKWSVQYLIDNSRTIFGRPQKVSPRHNRGLALSPDGKYLYAGYNHSFSNAGEVRRIALDSNDYDRATVAVLPGPMGKAIATDDKGRVYISDESAILIYDAGLHLRQMEINTGVCEGIAVAREGHELVLYSTDRSRPRRSPAGCCRKRKTPVVGAKAKGFDGNGEFKVPGATDLRGLKEDEKGNLWIADLKGNKVFKISRDGKTVNSAQVATPMDIAFDGEPRASWTRYADRAISVLDENMAIAIGNLAIPWEELRTYRPSAIIIQGALSGDRDDS